MKKVKYNKTSINQLSNEKPVVYTIETEGNRPNYIGSAKGNRVIDRIKEHLDLGKIPGATVKIRQFDTVSKAKEAEKKAIKSKQPKYNQQGK